MRRLSGLVVVAVLAACAQGGPSGSLQIVAAPSRVVMHDVYASLQTWSSKTDLVIGYELTSDPAKQTDRLWTIGIDGGSPTPLSVPSDGPCTTGRLGLASRNSAGGIVFVEQCVIPGAFETRFLQWDLSGTTVTTLGTLPQDVHAYSVSPNGKIYAAVGSRICEGIGEVRRGVLHPLDIELSDGVRSFSLADTIAPTDDCSKLGRADYPAWSPDAGTLAFVASTAAIGASGPDRLDAPSGLYLWSNEPRLEPVLRGLIHAADLKWDPTGTWLAFGAEIQGSGTGTWLFNVRTRNLVRVAEQSAIASAWSPDGESLAISVDLSTTEVRNDVIVIDVSSVVNG
jgi:hypothetical protein